MAQDAQDTVMYYVDTCEKLGVGVLMEVVEWLAGGGNKGGGGGGQAGTESSDPALRLTATTDGEVESVCATLAKVNNSLAALATGGDSQRKILLSRLEFFDGKFSVRGVSALASAIENDTCIQALRLSNCSVGDNGALALADSLIRNPRCALIELDLCNIGMDMRGLEALTTAGERE